ncbi:probable beta-tubulin polyglutamylase [Haliotis rufescens]|uniref:probable beta-tubulin polyglutamylase n=1 Tax=Haliotis rufescens TaxID=6454 RepID=UPI00201FB0B7|nr:probable beta-tubulin polyglutamylase [Haliotis rufescens]XP_048239904.1 probable beta-tubulin polyglutamylase [Haliotis rufescens]
MDGKAIVFRVNEGQGPELLNQVFLEKGWLEYDETTQDEYDWNIWWRTSRFRACDYEHLMPWQRLNHYPKSTGITRKDSLARNLKRMRGVYGAGVFNFSPIAFNLPNDYTRYVAEYSKLKQNTDSKTLLWICKPADLSRGRGIFLFRELSELQYDCSAVVQRYIANPLLISGYKFDMRIYVAVPSFHPLSVYIYQEGIVRFSTEKFDLNNINNVFAHLTNTSINKHSPSYGTDKGRVGPGCKWTLNQLRYYFHQNNIKDEKMWKRITNIVILTLLTQASMVSKVDNCFEMYGFDILVDENLKPWLLEVNFSPSLTSDCLADILVKKPLLHDLMDMMNFKDADVERGGEAFHRHQSNKSHSSLISDRNTSVSRLSRGSGVNKLPSVPNSSRKTSAKGDLNSNGDYSRGSGFMCMADGDEEANKPIFGLPLVNHSDDEGYPSDNDEKPHTKSPRTLKKGKSETSLPKSSSSVSDSRMRDGCIQDPRSARSDHASAMKSGYKLHKVHSKGSSISDSGVSSFSGCSENSDLMPSRQGQNSRDSIPPLFLPIGAPDSSSNTPENEKIPKRTESVQRKPSVKRYGYATSYKKSRRSPFKSVSQLTTVTKVGRNAFIGTANNFEVGNQAEPDDASQTTTSSPTPTKFSVRRRQSQISVSDTSQIRKSTTVPRNNVRSLNSGPSPSTQKQFNGTRKPALRPGKNHFGLTKPPVSKGPKEVIGDFYLVFPFSEVTRKASAASLDARLIIRETQKLQKESSGKGGGAREAPRIWGPLKNLDGS